VRVLMMVALVAACSSKRSEPTPGSGSAVPSMRPEPVATGPEGDVKGAIVVAGETLAITRCNPQHDVHTFLELETAKGILRFKEAKLYWQDKELACARLDRSWGGGVRPDGAAYWRGMLDFDCGNVTGKVEADCGRITADERASLDSNRKNLLDEQAAQRDAAMP
jgi:hypothetical protein